MRREEIRMKKQARSKLLQYMHFLPGLGQRAGVGSEGRHLGSGSPQHGHRHPSQERVRPLRHVL